MYELLFLVLLISLVLLSLRRGKSVVDTPLIIERDGQYHITVAPQLVAEQAFIEKIADQFTQAHSIHGDTHSLFFEVCDAGVAAKNVEFYLLAVTVRRGKLYFQAINPQPLLRDADSHLKQLQAYSEAVLALLPLEYPVERAEVEALRSAVEMTARQLNIITKPLIESE